MYKVKRYDELKVNDIIWFHGAKVRVIAVREFPYDEEFYKDQTDKVIYFDIESVDEEAIKILGKFYSHGTYGGVGCLEVNVVL